jgi:hypothetical protein
VEKGPGAVFAVRGGNGQAVGGDDQAWRRDGSGPPTASKVRAKGAGGLPHSQPQRLAQSSSRHEHDPEAWPIFPLICVEAVYKTRRLLEGSLLYTSKLLILERRLVGTPRFELGTP